MFKAQHKAVHSKPRCEDLSVCRRFVLPCLENPGRSHLVLSSFCVSENFAVFVNLCHCHLATETETCTRQYILGTWGAPWIINRDTHIDLNHICKGGVVFSVSVQKFVWESMSMLQSTTKSCDPSKSQSGLRFQVAKGLPQKSFSFLKFLYVLTAPLDDSVATSTPQSLVCWAHGPSTAWTGAYQNPHKTQALMLLLIVAMKKVRRRIWIRKGFEVTRRNRTNSTTTTTTPATTTTTTTTTTAAAATPQRDHTDRTTRQQQKRQHVNNK